MVLLLYGLWFGNLSKVAANEPGRFPTGGRGVKHSSLLLGLAIGLLVLLAACASETTPSATPSPTPQTEPVTPTLPSTPTSDPTNTPTARLRTTPTPDPTATARALAREAAEAIAREAALRCPAFVEVALWGQDPGSVTFRGPNGIAIDSSDNVYVTEFRGSRVQRFTPDGALLARWGSPGTEIGSS